MGGRKEKEKRKKEQGTRKKIKKHLTKFGSHGGKVPVLHLGEQVSHKRLQFVEGL